MRIGLASTACAVVVAAACLAGCGGSTLARRGQDGVGGPTVCDGIPTSAAAAGARPCVLVLSDGTRFRCPQDFARMVTDTLELAGTCRPLPPVPIPLAWRVVLADLERTRSCLGGEGMHGSG